MLTENQSYRITQIVLNFKDTPYFDAINEEAGRIIKEGDWATASIWIGEYFNGELNNLPQIIERYQNVK